MRVSFELNEETIKGLGNPGLNRHLAKQTIDSIESQLPRKRGQFDEKSFTVEQTRLYQVALRLRRMHFFH